MLERLPALRRFAEAPDGRLHKLEAHQIARQLSPDSHLVARLYRQDPPLLQAERDMRVLTDAGRAWLEEHAGATGVSAMPPRPPRRSTSSSRASMWSGRAGPGSTSQAGSRPMSHEFVPWSVNGPGLSARKATMS